MREIKHLGKHQEGNSCTFLVIDMEIDHAKKPIPIAIAKMKAYG